MSGHHFSSEQSEQLLFLVSLQHKTVAAMKMLLLPFFFAVAMSAQIGMNQAGGAYNFHYATGDAGGHQRSESGHGGTVSGSYSYVDPNGNPRHVSYTAGPQGFVASGDTSVDKKTAADAAAIAALAPKPVPAAPAALPAYHHYGPYYHHNAAWAHHAVPGYAHWGAHW